MNYPGIIYICIAMFLGVFIGTIIFHHFEEKPAPSPKFSPESSKVLSEVSSVLDETHEGWVECTKQRKEEVKILKVCSTSLGECLELLERAVE